MSDLEARLLLKLGQDSTTFAIVVECFIRRGLKAGASVSKHVNVDTFAQHVSLSPSLQMSLSMSCGTKITLPIRLAFASFASLMLSEKREGSSFGARPVLEVVSALEHYERVKLSLIFFIFFCKLC